MDLATEPDVYVPWVDNAGNYIDKTPNFSHLPCGIRCPCGGRKDRYTTSLSFLAHTKTKLHQKWLGQLTDNKTNYYVENEAAKTTIHNQKRIIARLEKDLVNRNRTIDYLTEQLAGFLERKDSPHSVGNLLEFD